jgi:hypothetical protein
MEKLLLLGERTRIIWSTIEHRYVKPQPQSGFLANYTVAR